MAAPGAKKRKVCHELCPYKSRAQALSSKVNMRVAEGGGKMSANDYSFLIKPMKLIGVDNDGKFQSRNCVPSAASQKPG